MAKDVITANVMITRRDEAKNAIIDENGITWIEMKNEQYCPVVEFLSSPLDEGMNFIEMDDQAINIYLAMVRESRDKAAQNEEVCPPPCSDVGI